MNDKKTKASTAKSGTLTVKQVRSGAARDKKFKATLCSLGLGRIGKSSELPANPAVVGMVARVAAVVQVTVNK